MDLNVIHHGDCLEVMRTMPDSCIDSVVTDPPYGLSFMGKQWDHGVPGVPFWEAALRVAKPGAMLLAFGGTRTFHRLTCAIEDAGWEIRDCLMWLHGSGFPKSMDISKAMDKAAGAEREVIGTKFRRELPSDVPFGQGMVASHANAVSGREIKNSVQLDITAPATDLAKQWNGWGTALKPAWEPIILAMKPLVGTFAKNAETHGVAGLNVDGCRIGDNPGYKYNADSNGTTFHGQQGERQRRSAAKKGSDTIESTKGRWPANVILDEDAGALLDEQSGASRFFYCAKAAKSEKGADNTHPTVKPLKLMEYLCRLTATPTGGIVLDPFCGSGSTLLAARNTGRDYVGIELNEEYAAIARQRLESREPLFV